MHAAKSFTAHARAVYRRVQDAVNGNGVTAFRRYQTGWPCPGCSGDLEMGYADFERRKEEVGWRDSN